MPKIDIGLEEYKIKVCTAGAPNYDCERCSCTVEECMKVQQSLKDCDDPVGEVLFHCAEFMTNIL